MDLIKLYFKYLSIQVRSVMQYKTSFFLTLFGQLCTSFAAFLGVYLLMNRFNEVEGFTKEEVLLCFAVVLMSFSLAEGVFRGFDQFSGMIGNGSFERILTRPRPLIFQVLASKVEFTRLGRILQSAVVFAFVIPRCGVHWSADKILTLILMILGGVVVFAGLFVIYAGLCFFSTEGLEFMNIFTDGGKEFGAYPFSIYGKAVLRFFTFVVPLALCQYYPLLYLLGRSENVLLMFVPVLSVVFLIPCNIIWRIGVRHFRGTGS